jgi:hypothetical protein
LKEISTLVTLDSKLEKDTASVGLTLEESSVLQERNKIYIAGAYFTPLYLKFIIGFIMGYKSDIQATRSTAGNTGTAVIAGPIRLRGIIVANDGVGAGVLELTTTSNTGDTLFTADVPQGDVINFSFPEDGIPFPKGIFVKTKTNVAAFTLLTDKYSAPGLTY